MPIGQRFHTMNAKPNNVPFEPADTESLGTVGDAPPLLNLKTALGMCVKVEVVYYPPWQGHRLVFTFHLVDPAPFQGTKLQMYVRQDPDWKTLPVASKLYKVARVAGGPFMRGQDVTKSLFLRKIFKCELAVVGTGAAAYSIVKTITEKVAG